MITPERAETTSFPAPRFVKLCSIERRGGGGEEEWGSFSIDVHSAPIDMNFEAYLIAARCYT